MFSASQNFRRYFQYTSLAISFQKCAPQQIYRTGAFVADLPSSRKICLRTTSVRKKMGAWSQERLRPHPLRRNRMLMEVLRGSRRGYIHLARCSPGEWSTLHFMILPSSKPSTCSGSRGPPSATALFVLLRLTYAHADDRHFGADDSLRRFTIQRRCFISPFPKRKKMEERDERTDFSR